MILLYVLLFLNCDTVCQLLICLSLICYSLLVLKHNWNFFITQCSAYYSHLTSWVCVLTCWWSEKCIITVVTLTHYDCHVIICHFSYKALWSFSFFSSLITLSSFSLLSSSIYHCCTFENIKKHSVKIHIFLFIVTQFNTLTVLISIYCNIA